MIYFFYPNLTIFFLLFVQIARVFIYLFCYLWPCYWIERKKITSIIIFFASLISIIPVFLIDKLLEVLTTKVLQKYCKKHSFYLYNSYYNNKEQQSIEKIKLFFKNFTHSLLLSMKFVFNSLFIILLLFFYIFIPFKLLKQMIIQPNIPSLNKIIASLIEEKKESGEEKILNEMEEKKIIPFYLIKGFALLLIFLVINNLTEIFKYKFYKDSFNSYLNFLENIELYVSAKINHLVLNKIKDYDFPQQKIKSKVFFRTCYILLFFIVLFIFYEHLLIFFVSVFMNIVFLTFLYYIIYINKELYGNNINIHYFFHELSKMIFWPGKMLSVNYISSIFIDSALGYNGVKQINCKKILLQSGIYIIVAESGSGKTTLMQTLANSLGYREFNGNILVNGKQLYDIKRSKLQSHIFYGRQLAELPDSTIAEFLFHSQILKDEIINLMKLLGLNLFINKFNYEIKKGQVFSLGERSRLIIVKLLRDLIIYSRNNEKAQPLIIIDELFDPFSSETSSSSENLVDHVLDFIEKICHKQPIILIISHKDQLTKKPYKVIRKIDDSLIIV